jgi:hypothetical protein
MLILIYFICYIYADESRVTLALLFPHLFLRCMALERFRLGLTTRHTIAVVCATHS